MNEIKPITKEMIMKADMLLAESYLSTKDTILAIINHKDPDGIDDCIDYIEGVVVWEKLEYSLNRKDFLTQIGYY